MCVRTGSNKVALLSVCLQLDLLLAVHERRQNMFGYEMKYDDVNVDEDGGRLGRSRTLMSRGCHRCTLRVQTRVDRRERMKRCLRSTEKRERPDDGRTILTSQGDTSFGEVGGPQRA